jgi:hypothetical protein
MLIAYGYLALLIFIQDESGIVYKQNNNVA